MQEIFEYSVTLKCHNSKLVINLSGHTVTLHFASMTFSAFHPIHSFMHCTTVQSNNHLTTQLPNKHGCS